MTNQDWISETSAIGPCNETIRIIVDEDVKARVNAIQYDIGQLRNDYCAISSQVGSVTISQDTIKNLTARITTLEKIVWRLEDYIENGLDTEYKE